MKLSVKSIREIAKTLTDAVGQALGLFGFSLSTIKGDLEKNIQKRIAERDAALKTAAAASGAPLLSSTQAPFGFRASDKTSAAAFDELQRRDQQRIEEAKRQVESFTGSLTSAIGTAITDGILEGKKAMETLADIGAQLFRNFTNDAMANLQKGLTAAIKAVAGSDEVAGAFSGLFSALLGIAGGVISILQRKRSSSKSFNPVTGKIESTQPLRGIVAGPSSIAIAAVGENLERALAPTNDILRGGFAAVVSAIRGKGGGSGVGGFGFAGSVATT